MEETMHDETLVAAGGKPDAPADAHNGEGETLAERVAREEADLIRLLGEVGETIQPQGEKATLAEALALPEPLGDLWPGHVYLPPKITQLEIILPLVRQMRDEFLAGNVMESINRAVSVTKMLARKIDGDKLLELSEAEIKDTFDEDEIAEIVNHMMFKQGLVVKGPEGNVSSGRLIGLKNFRRSAASTPVTDSNTAETSPSPSSEGS